MAVVPLKVFAKGDPSAAAFPITSVPVPALVRFKLLPPLSWPLMVVTFCKSGTVRVCAPPPVSVTGPVSVTPFPASAVPPPESGPKVALAAIFTALPMERSVPSLSSAVPSAMFTGPEPTAPARTEFAPVNVSLEFV